MALALWWEREERQALTLWGAAMAAGSEDVPSPSDVWDIFATELARPPARRRRDELALRRALGVA